MHVGQHTAELGARAQRALAQRPPRRHQHLLSEQRILSDTIQKCICLCQFGLVQVWGASSSWKG